MELSSVNGEMGVRSTLDTERKWWVCASFGLVC